MSEMTQENQRWQKQESRFKAFILTINSRKEICVNFLFMLKV